MPSDLTSEAIAAKALEPIKVQGDAGSMEQRSIDEMIAADKYNKTQTAVAKPMGGMSFTRVIPSGSI